MRVIFFGMTGRFSIAPLEKLLSVGVEVCAVVVPATQSRTGSTPRRIEPPSPGVSDLPITDPYLEHNIVHLAWAGNIPVWEVASLSEAQALAMLTDLQPDLISVACFPHIFPASLLQLPRYGCFNLHPSLLPAYRGPAPLFWIARQDERKTGVTLHFLDDGLDSGYIVAQTSFERPDGISGAELEQLCAEAGAVLLLTVIRQLEQGPLPRHPQVETEARYFSQPAKADLIIPTDWSAQHAFNFLRGAENWPLIIDIGQTRFFIRVATSYDLDRTLDHPYIVLGDKLWVQFQPGVLRAKIYT